MYTRSIPIQLALALLILLSCSGRKSQTQRDSELASLNLNSGDLTLCGSGISKFGTVDFSQSCSEKVRPDFNLAVALLHSFEYTEAEKVFAKIIEQDPECIMAYWGAAMCSFHPLWEPPGESDLQKGSKIIEAARAIAKDKSTRESDYLEVVATIYDQWETLDYRRRLLKFEEASQRIFEKYPDDTEGAVFYALALDAAADPADKTFQNQKKAGQILNAIFVKEPDHPGVAHYLIHNYDYPELAKLALPAARKYASIAAASAHAQHMPSHIFTRLGLWDEASQSNLNSVSAAQCYAENIGAEGHWDEELHGLDYLIYAFLQKADDDKALEQIGYLKTIREVFPHNFKVAYAFAAAPARYALERKDWVAAASLHLEPADFPWEKFQWEKANINFGRLLGAVHTRKIEDARAELGQLHSIHAKLSQTGENYKANLVSVQLKAGEAWIKLAEGRDAQAIDLMTEAANMEEATAKHPVTPGEIIPARELLGDMYLELGRPASALEAYKADLKIHPGRFNGIFGAGVAAEKTGNVKEATIYFEQLASLPGARGRPAFAVAESFLKKSR